MQSHQLYEKILEIPVFDTHTHMETAAEQPTKGLCASSFFHIAWYFWFRRELEAAGYPFGSERDIGEDEYAKEAELLESALQRTRNTCWTGTVMRAMRELYGIIPDSAGNILALSEKMRSCASDPGWAQKVCDRLAIKKIVAARDTRNVMRSIAHTYVHVPACGIRDEMLQDVTAAADPLEEAESAKQKLAADIDAYMEEGVRTIRLAWPFVQDIDLACDDELNSANTRDPEKVRQHLGHFLMRYMQEYKLNLQIFFGMNRPERNDLSDLKIVRLYALNNPAYVASMHNVFEMYRGLTFELFCGAELSSLDMVQAARIYPNVYPGGLWWFNFRRSVYEKNMQYRLEAIPACRSSFVASDARCIEWCYIKISLIKRLMAGFFTRQIDEGWLDEETALYTAKWWLHDCAAELYLTPHAR